MTILAATLSIPSIASVELTSPSGNVRAVFSVSADGHLQYAASRDGKAVLENSALGVTVDGVDLGGDVASLTAGQPSTVHKTYAYRGVKPRATDRYTQITLTAKPKGAGDSTLKIVARAYDDGVAYRYLIPGNGARKITGEASSWALPPKSEVYWEPDTVAYEGTYRSNPIGSFTSNAGGPITFELPGRGQYASGFACITEGALYNYSGMSFHVDEGSTTFHAIFQDDKEWEVQGGSKTPWRLTIITPDLDALVNSTLVANVSPPPSKELANAKWIKPGKALWSWWAHGTRLEDQERYIDAAHDMKFPYVLWDEGWPSWPQDKFDGLLKRAIDKNVKVWLWIHWSQLADAAEREKFFKWIDDKNKEMGSKIIVGVKIDFMNSECIARVRFYQGTLEDAARHELMINFHGANKPTGEYRTYPNEMTREGIHGLEHNKFSDAGIPVLHNAILPFTRLIAGHADYTPGAIGSYLGRGTPAHHLASGIIYTSPVTHWADDPVFYLDSPVRPIIEAAPTLWDETRVLNKHIGDVAMFARRSGKTWFLAVMHGDNTKNENMSIPLKFLEDGVRYNAVTIFDDLADPTKLKNEDKQVSAKDSLDFTLFGGDWQPGMGGHGGGFVAMLTPMC